MDAVRRLLLVTHRDPSVAGAAVETLTKAIGDSVFSTDGRAIEVVIGDELKARALTVGAAESCTGGLVAGRLTDVPGSSAYVHGGVVAYSSVV